MRKRIMQACILALALGVPAWADQITFSFVAPPGNAVDFKAKQSGMSAGPADNITISDTTKGLHEPLAGVFSASAGDATQFAIGASFVGATFEAGGQKSVLITEPDGDVLIAGMMEGDAAMLAEVPKGTGSFLGTFIVTEVGSDVLKLFNLSGFDPNGSVAFTFGQDTLQGKTLDAVVGGGSVTFIGTPAAVVSEPGTGTLGLFGLGLLTTWVFWRKV